MSSAAVIPESPSTHETDSLGVPLPLDSLNEPGTYVCNWSGNLLRVHDTDTTRYSTACHTPLQQWTVTRISPDPDLSRFEAKALAGNFGLATSF
jgi:hypothetical protein